jgi:hypothetical protein
MRRFKHAKVAELADAPDLGSGGETREGSSPSFRTNSLRVLGFRRLFAVPKIVPTRQFCESTLDGFGLRMAVALCNGDGAVPCNPG